MAITSTNWGTVALNSTNYTQGFDSLTGRIMDDAVCLMDDATYTMDDAKSNSVMLNPTNWTT